MFTHLFLFIHDLLYVYILYLLHKKWFFKLCIPQRDYITLKGIGKILLVLLFRIFPICKFLNFTVALHKKVIKLPEVLLANFPCEEVNFGLVHPTLITIHSFLSLEELQVYRFCQLAVKITFKQTAKDNDYLIFLILFVFTVVFFLELETRERWIVQRVHLYALSAAVHELEIMPRFSISVISNFLIFLTALLIDKWSFFSRW